MNAIKWIPVLFLAVLLTACSPRVAQPPPLEELEPPSEDTLSDSDLGPQDFSDLESSPTDDWGGEFTGEQELTNRPTGEWRSEPALETVYFDYDKYDLNSEARQTLLRNVDFLKRHPELRVLIEGHCDERGTEQYNQALGENRALAVREYLIQLGISPNRIDIISYGELLPAVEGHNESAWRWNRRAEFKVAG